MSRNPGYSRAGANGGYTNGNYTNAGYGGYGAAENGDGDRPSGERRRRPGGYGGLSAADDQSPQRPSNDRDRDRDRDQRPGGYGGYRGIARDDESARRPSSDRQRRPGGYGGLPARSEERPQVTRPTSIERAPAQRRSPERRAANESRQNRAGTSYGPGSQRIDQVLQYIQQNWEFMTKDQCVPIEVALKLMDSSSLGLASQAGRFRQTHDELQQALKGIVNGALFVGQEKKVKVG